VKPCDDLHSQCNEHCVQQNTENGARKKNVTENDDHSPDLDRIVIEYAERRQRIGPEHYATWRRDALFAEADKEGVFLRSS
jgi:hypothetical protein